MNSRIHVEYTTLENIGQFIKYAVRNPDITINTSIIAIISTADI